MQEFGLEKIEALLTGCADKVLATPFPEFVLSAVVVGESRGDAPGRDVERALTDILRPKEKRSATIMDWPRNMWLIFANRWKYSYVPNSWSERIKESVVGKFKREIGGDRNPNC